MPDLDPELARQERLELIVRPGECDEDDDECSDWERHKDDHYGN